MNGCIWTAEIGINHNGQMENVYALIDLAKKHRFDYVKFQKRDIDSCYTKEYLDSPRESPWGKTQREQKEGLELSLQDYESIDAYCRTVGIGWYYSPWDVNSAKAMSIFNTDYVKIAKACLTHKGLQEYYNQTDDSLIVSVNAIDKNTINSAKMFYNLEYVLNCVSIYPSPDNFNGLKYIDALYKYDFNSFPKFGYSNHSPNWIHPVIASYLGAEMIEVHITLDKDMYGSDQKASLDDNDLTQMMKYRYSPLSKSDEYLYLIKEAEVLKKLRQTW